MDLGWVELLSCALVLGCFVYSKQLEEQGLARLESRVRIVGATVFFLVLVRAFVLEPFHGQGPSMLPTLPNQSLVLVDKSAFGVRIPGTASWVWRRASPQPGEVVVARSPESPDWLLKRVVAVGGDEVRVEGERVFVNGQALEHAPATSWESSPQSPWSWQAQVLGRSHRVLLKTSESSPSPHIVTWQVPAGHVFLVGDNRFESLDSRTFGPVHSSEVMGRVAWVWTDDGFSWPDSIEGGDQ